MLSNFGFGEIAVLALFAMLVFGPEKLPRAAMDAARVIKKLRAMAEVTVNDFKSELPAELADLDLRAMDPRRIVTSALFDSDRNSDNNSNRASTSDNNRDSTSTSDRPADEHPVTATVLDQPKQP